MTIDPTILAAADAAFAAATPETGADTAVIIDEPRRLGRAVFSTRLDADTSHALLAEADRTRIPPSTLLGVLAAEALAARAAQPATPAGMAMVNVADLHRAIDAAVRQAA